MKNRLSLKLTSKSLQTMYHCVTNTHMYIYNVHIHMNSKLKRDIKSILCYNCCNAVDAMFLLYIELTSNKTVFTISITPQWTSSHHHSILQMLQLYGQLKQIFCLLRFESWETKWQLNTNIENKKLNCFIIFDAKSYCVFRRGDSNARIRISTRILLIPKITMHLW